MFLGHSLEGVSYLHPLTKEELHFLPGFHVTKNKGTGLVHTSPAHGPDDFRVSRLHDLSVVGYHGDETVVVDWVLGCIVVQPYSLYSQLK